MQKKAAVIIGHPGHELRAFKFIKDFKPDVFILTDGSGSANQSRIHQTIKILDSLGSNYNLLFKPFTDKELYNIILENKVEELLQIKTLLKNEFLNKQYNIVLGDALEGFNPTHDLCRYLINAVIKEILLEHNEWQIANYDFLLDAAPDKDLVKNNSIGFSLKLDKEEFEMKYLAAQNYPELKFEVEKALEIYGEQAFMTEYFGQVIDFKELSNWSSTSPGYEIDGRKKVEDGVYANVITFENHMKPIANILLGL